MVALLLCCMVACSDGYSTLASSPDQSAAEPNALAEIVADCEVSRLPPIPLTPVVNEPLVETLGDKGGEQKAAENFSEAVVLFEAAAELGDASSAVEAGVFRFRGLGGKRDYTSAHRLFEFAYRRKNDRNAAWHLGMLHSDHLVECSDVEQAELYLTEAVELNERRALSALAKLYIRQGKNVEAAAVLRNAIETGIPETIVEAEEIDRLFNRWGQCFMLENCEADLP
ncbi:MAG: hypothetical protein AAFX86_12100 [Pseudomonadota bacterium]